MVLFLSLLFIILLLWAFFRARQRTPKPKAKSKSTSDSAAKELERLERLRKESSLSDAEYYKLRSKILSK